MKYLHYFETAADFTAAYNNEEEGSYVKSIVTPLGTFAYSGGNQNNFYWVNPATQKVLMTLLRVPNIGIWDYAASGHPENPDDFLGAIDTDKLREWSGEGNPPEGTFVEITALNWGDVHYSEPWVSYTPDSGLVEYNKNIWVDLSSYQYPTRGGGDISLGALPNPQVTSVSQTVLVREPDNKTHEYYCREIGADYVVFTRSAGIGLQQYKIVFVLDGNSYWRYESGEM